MTGVPGAAQVDTSEGGGQWGTGGMGTKLTAARLATAAGYALCQTLTIGAPWHGAGGHERGRGAVGHRRHGDQADGGAPGHRRRLRMAICSAAAPERVTGIVHGERVGTVFRPHPHALRCGLQCLGIGLCQGLG